MSTNFGGSSYAFEELVAELGSAMLCNNFNIEGKLQHTEYIASWLKALNDDEKAILKASAKAQKAFDYLIGDNNESRKFGNNSESTSSIQRETV
jgi:antirestriction protein ArdC